MQRRILILAPKGRDALVIDQILARVAIQATICADVRELLAEMTRGADVAVATEEGFTDTDLGLLRRWLGAQPSWADFPFIILASPHGLRPRDLLQTLTTALGNVVVLERPINAETLSSAVASAFRARDRQYQARSHWIARENDERRLRTALSAGNLGAWTFDLTTRTLDASERFRAHLGLVADEPLALTTLMGAIHRDDRPRFRDAATLAIDQQADFGVECRVVWPDGQVRWVQVSGRTIYGDDGRPATVSGVSLDVTSRHDAEEELQRRVNEAVADNQRAQVALVQAQKMEAVGQLTGGIAHDFNNLLTAIVGNIDLIDRRASDDKIKVMANRARHAADRAAKLTGQLLAFSRSQRLDLRPIDVDRLIREMHDLVTRTIGQTVAVAFELGAGGRMATADANQIELAVLNLAINARDAMPGGGTLHIRTRAETTGENPFLVIAVRDTGSGIAPDILPRVFDPFFTTKPVGKGTGLGLSQVHGIAHQSGGSVKISSTVGIGTTIEIWLKEVVGGSDLADEEQGEDEGLFLGRGRVLVIDDDADVRRFVVTCLETLGFEVTQADNGRAGLDRLDEDWPDLLIVDFAMPGMNGAEVASAARQRRSDLPIILATGYADTGQVVAAFSQDAILRKPFRIQELSRAVRHALATRA